MAGGFVMKFEDKKFCKLSTLADRWDVSIDRLRPLLERKDLLPWHPEKKVGAKGILVDVQSILRLEQNNYIDLLDADE